MIHDEENEYLDVWSKYVDVAVKIFDAGNETSYFYTINDTKTNKRADVYSFFSIDFSFFNKEFKIVLEIFHLFIATKNVVKELNIYNNRFQLIFSR